MAGLQAQDCTQAYQSLPNLLGVFHPDTAASGRKACELRAAFPDSVQTRFAVFSGTLYRYSPLFRAEFLPQAIERMEATAAAASPYYRKHAVNHIFPRPPVKRNLAANQKDMPWPLETDLKQRRAVPQRCSP